MLCFYNKGSSEMAAICTCLLNNSQNSWESKWHIVTEFVITGCLNEDILITSINTYIIITALKISRVWLTKLNCEKGMMGNSVASHLLTAA